jgi:hypothetical protein
MSLMLPLCFVPCADVHPSAIGNGIGNAVACSLTSTAFKQVCGKFAKRPKRKTETDLSVW